MSDIKKYAGFALPALGRRAFFKQVGMAGIGAAAITAAGGGLTTLSAESKHDDDDDNHAPADTAQQIFTAALIAEDLATTFYYNGLTGPVIQDPALAGPGGSALNVLTSNADRVGYLRAALSEEITHADLLRSLIGGSSFSTDPFQTFFFPAGSFDNLSTFLAVLDALENAFIGAYLAALQEFGSMAARVEPFDRKQLDASGRPLSKAQLVFFAKVAASIMGVEAEHRTLGRDIGDVIPANNLCFEQTDGIQTVFNGPHSAVAALTPFVTPGSAGFAAEGFSLADARNNSEALVLPCTGGLPV